MGPKREKENGLVAQAEVRAIQLQDDGIMPNNGTLRLLIYHGCLRLPERERGEAIEKLVRSQGWAGTWVNGIYPYHHYHSTAHELLVVVRGSCEAQFGGSRGVAEHIQAGDAVIIPAGVAHKNNGSSQDFEVVGAYPEGQKWDLCTGKPEERPQADENIKRVPLPASDPIYGTAGPLMQYWKT